MRADASFQPTVCLRNVFFCCCRFLRYGDGLRVSRSRQIFWRCVSCSFERERQGQNTRKFELRAAAAAEYTKICEQTTTIAIDERRLRTAKSARAQLPLAGARARRRRCKLLECAFCAERLIARL